MRPATYLQKIGRAGRLEFDITNPTSYLVVDDDVQYQHAKKLILRQVDFETFTSPEDPKLTSGGKYFSEGGAFDRMLLCWIVASKEKRGVQMNNLVDLVKQTYWYHLQVEAEQKKRSKRTKRKLQECNEANEKNYGDDGNEGDEDEEFALGYRPNGVGPRARGPRCRSPDGNQPLQARGTTGSSF